MPELRHVAPCCNMRQPGALQRAPLGCSRRLQPVVATGNVCSSRRPLPPACSIEARRWRSLHRASSHRSPEWRGLDVRMRYGTRHDCSTRTRSTLRVPCCAGVLGLPPAAGGQCALRSARRRFDGGRKQARHGRSQERSPSTHVRLFRRVLRRAKLRCWSTAADRRSGGSPGSHVLQTATAFCTTGLAACGANPPSERAATFCGPLDLARRRLMASIAMWRRIRVGRRRPSR